jgi:YbbR domain-containing protein
MVQKDRQELMVSVLSIFIAFVLWLYVMGDKNPMQTKVIENIPVTLVNTENISQANLALLPNQNFTVNLAIEGRALDVFNSFPADFRVEADMGGYLKRGDNNIPVEVKSTPRGISVMNKNGYPYIRIKLDSLVDKSVPVQVNIAGDAKDGYEYIEADVRPTDVLVSGPATYVNSVYSVTGQIDVTGNYSTVNGSIPLKAQDKEGKNVPYISIEPKFVDVSIPIKPSKEVPIAVKTTGQLQENKVLKSISPQIIKVIIIGDKEVIDKIKKIDTVPYNISRLTETSIREIELNIPPEVSVVGNIKSVNVDFGIEEIISKTFEVPLELINKGDDLNYSTSTNNVSVTLVGTESVINSINSQAITATTDLKGIAEGEHALPTKINAPENVTIKDYSPQKVSITVVKK